MVFWGLWMARRHLLNVARKAFGKAPEVDDSGEFFSYRKAVLGLFSGTIYIIVPIGFTVSTTLPVALTAFSIFLAWAAKFIILKLGGIRAYKKAQPFFLGLVIGEFTGSGLALIVDAIWFVGQGHELTGW